MRNLVLTRNTATERTHEALFIRGKGKMDLGKLLADFTKATNNKKDQRRQQTHQLEQEKTHYNDECFNAASIFKAFVLFKVHFCEFNSPV